MIQFLINNRSQNILIIIKSIITKVYFKFAVHSSFLRILHKDVEVK